MVARAQDTLTPAGPETTASVAPPLVQLPAELDSFNLMTPRRAVASHLMYLQLNNYHPEIAAQVLTAPNLSEVEKERVARKLKQIYDGENYYVEIGDIPDDPAYVDSASGKMRYVIFPKYPDIFVEAKEGVWKYSRRSVQQIPKIHKSLFPFGADFLLNLFPKFGQRNVLGLQLWQIIGLLMLFVLSYILYRLLDWIAKIMIRRILPKIFTHHIIDLEKIPPVAHPLSLLVVTLILTQLVRMLLLGEYLIGKYLDTGLRIAYLVFGVVVLYRLVNLLSDVFARAAATTDTRMDDQLVPLVSKIARLLVVMFGGVFILQNLDINVMALLAGVSFIGLALAFAAQDTVKHFFGSIAIFVDRPFAIGDFIVAGSFSGTVVEVGVRSTRIRALEGALVTVPNGELAGLTVTNHGNRTYRRYETNVALIYGTPPELILQFVEQMRTLVFDHPRTLEEGSRAYFHEMADSSLNINLVIVFDLTDFGEMLKVRQEIFLAIMHLAADLGVDFAFPSTSVYLESMPPRIE